MTQPIPRVLNQESLANGRLPRTLIPRISDGQRSGETRDGGEATARRTRPAMSKGLLRGLTLAAFAALGTISFVASAGAATKITSCGTPINTFGEIYVLTGDLTALTSCDTCLVVANDRITIDLAGHTITGSCKARDCADGDVLCQVIGAGVTDGGTPRLDTTVKNGTITGFDFGVSLGASEGNAIRNLEVSDNTAIGLLLGARSLVRGCLIERNGESGINIGDFGRVLDSKITGPAATGGSNGIFGGNNLVIADNTLVGNQTGISVGDFGTVVRNTSSSNTGYGVLAGNQSLVAGNRTNDNRFEGISTGGRSTVSNNISNGNGGGGVLAGNESLVTGNTTNKNGDAGIATVGLNTVSNNISNSNGGGGINLGADDLFDGTGSWVTGNITNGNRGVGVEAWCPSTVTNNKSSGNGSGEPDNYNLKPVVTISGNNINGPKCFDKNNN
jgi:hypothetical protein